MIVYQTDDEGVFVGVLKADKSPRDAGAYLIPRGCVTAQPPSYGAGSRARWANGAWLVETVPVEAPPSGPETMPPTTLAKADLWRRLTEEEAEVLDAALEAAPPRLRRIYEAAAYLDHSDADFPALRAGIASALGEARADAVLAV